MSESHASATTFRLGDRVRTPGGVNGTVCAVSRQPRCPYMVKASNYVGWFNPEELALITRMSAPARALLAAWHASDRTLERIDRPNSSNRVNVNHGRAIRRYCTPDRSIDLTIAVEVK